jgi:RNA polymerase sigma factor (sigma-70 family)
MSSSETVTHWIEQLKAGDSAAAQQIWERYFTKMVGLARKKLNRGGSRRRVADEEDVALSAFDSFCRGAAEGRFPLLSDRNNLWGLLIVITARKARDQLRHERRKSQGGGKVRGESVFLNATCPGSEGESQEAGLAEITGQEPSPEFAAQMANEMQHLLERLTDAGMRAVALCKLEGYTNAEIADKIECAERTVERRLRVIRTLWDDQKGRS